MKNIITGLMLVIALCILNPPILSADDVEVDFVERLGSFRVQIAKKASDLKQAYIRSEFQQNRELVDLQGRGRVSSDSKVRGYEIENNKSRAERDYEQLGKEIKALKSEINQYYKGKTPQRLKKIMGEIDISYLERYNDAIAPQPSNLVQQSKPAESRSDSKNAPAKQNTPVASPPDEKQSAKPDPMRNTEDGFSGVRPCDDGYCVVLKGYTLNDKEMNVWQASMNMDGMWTEGGVATFVLGYNHRDEQPVARIISVIAITSLLPPQSNCFSRESLQHCILEMRTLDRTRLDKAKEKVITDMLHNKGEWSKK